MNATKDVETPKTPKETPRIPFEKYCVPGGAKKFFDIVMKGIDRKAVGKAFEESFSSMKESMPNIPYERFAMSDEERRGASMSRRLEIRNGIANTCVYTALGAGFFWAKYLSLPSVEEESYTFPLEVEGLSNPDLRDSIRFLILRLGSDTEILDDPDPDADAKAEQREKNGEMVLKVFSDTVAAKLDIFDQVEWNEEERTMENLLARINVACAFLFASPSFDKTTGKEFFPQFIFSWDFNDGFGSFWEVTIGGIDYVDEYIDKVLEECGYDEEEEESAEDGNGESAGAENSPEKEETE